MLITATRQETVATLVTNAIRLQGEGSNALLRIIQEGMAGGHFHDYELNREFYRALGTRMSVLWDEMSILINSYLALGGSYEALPKPPFVVVRYSDNTFDCVNIPFPTATPLVTWALPVEDEAALEVLVAEGGSAVLAALIDAQPES